MQKHRACTLACLLLGLSPATAASAADQGGATSIGDAILSGTPLFEVRARYEDNAQQNLKVVGESLSVRPRLGWQTADFHGFKALVEIAGTFHLDDGHYNVAVPGGVSFNHKTAYPVINDPSYFDLNRAQLSWAALPSLTLTAGRQRILIDDQRFIGNSGWRQDEQRFDSVRADFSLDGLKATYAYIWHVDRVLGGHADWVSDSHLFNASYAFANPLKVEGFVYALEFASSPTNSTLTEGLRGSGSLDLKPVALTYSATWAHQSGYRDNPSHFGLDYWQADLAGTWSIATLEADYEDLGGNGTRGFITPLASTHPFQGWADAFAAVGGNKTHVDGIKDLNFGLTLRPDFSLGPLSKPEVQVKHYDFWADLTGAHIAQEWDAQFKMTVYDKLTASVSFALFDRAHSVPVGTVAAPPSRTKSWLILEYKL